MTGSSRYSLARARFLDGCDLLRGRVESFRHPAPGPEGEPLFLDVARLGSPEASTAIVVSSGTHGIEGRAGSEIQARFLGALASGRLRDSLARKSCELVFVHAVNPWGMAFGRRADESNVDVNRNFLSNFSALPSNSSYDELADVIAPWEWSPATRQETRERFQSFRRARGAAELDAAVMSGQYSHPRGLFFGGTSPSWSNVTLGNALRRDLANKQQVVVLDLHTGLGPAGEVTLVSNAAPDSAAWRWTTHWWGKRATTTMQDARSISPHLVGSLKLALPAILAPAEVIAVTVEFGTVKSSDLFEALQAENWLHHHADRDTPYRPMIEEKVLAAFDPRSAGWQEAVWNEAKWTLDAVLADRFGETLG